MKFTITAPYMLVTIDADGATARPAKSRCFPVPSGRPLRDEKRLSCADSSRLLGESDPAEAREQLRELCERFFYHYTATLRRVETSKVIERAHQRLLEVLKGLA